MSDTYSQWDNSAEWYDQNMGEVGDRLNATIIKPALFKLLGDVSGKSLLDVGCGSGYLSFELAKKAKSVIGVDFSEKFISLCKKKYSKQNNLDFQVQDITKPFSLSTDSFDVILSKMVLQYVSEIQMFAAESKRLLKAGGKVIVAVDHPFHSQYYWAQQLAGKMSSKYPNLKNYYAKDAQQKLSLWGKVTLTWFPRTIADYVNTFIEEGLTLVQMEELEETSGAITLPRVLVLVFTK